MLLELGEETVQVISKKRKLSLVCKAARMR